MGKDSGWRDSLEGKRAGEMDRLLVGESGRKGKGTWSRNLEWKGWDDTSLG